MKNFVLCSLITSCCSCSTVSLHPKGDIPDDLYSAYKKAVESGLVPKGVSIVRHPKRPEVFYYYTMPHAQARDPRRPGRTLGMWRSVDEGKTWRQLSDIPNWMEVFVHPRTKILYGLVRDRHLSSRETGFVSVARFATKLIMHQGGQHWRDITRDRGHFTNVIAIHQDPDNPNRVCIKKYDPLEGRPGVHEAGVYQATDDNYTNWQFHKRADWEKSHPRWDWDSIQPLGHRLVGTPVPTRKQLVKCPGGE